MSPSITWRSVRQIPQALTSIRSWPGPGAGIAELTARNGRPGVSSRIAAIEGLGTLAFVMVTHSTAAGASLVILRPLTIKLFRDLWRLRAQGVAIAHGLALIGAEDDPAA